MSVKISHFPTQSMQLENYPAYELGEIADNMSLDEIPLCPGAEILHFSYSSSGYSRKQCIN